MRSEYIESSEINDGGNYHKTANRYLYDIATGTRYDKRPCFLVRLRKCPYDYYQTIVPILFKFMKMYKEMAKIQKTLPSDVKIEVIYDSSDHIKNSINSLKESVLYALLLVVLIILFFLGRWRATFIIGITIPIALIVAFIYLLFVDSSLNIISLSSLTIAIGMVVDDAIVVLENIVRHIDRGSNPREASIYGTNEVWISVIASTLVIVVVFVPLTMLTGMAGIMFRVSWTKIQILPLLVAISLTPAVP